MTPIDGRLRRQVESTREMIERQVYAGIKARLNARLQVIAEIIPISKDFEVKWLIDEKRNLLRQIRELDGLD